MTASLEELKAGGKTPACFLTCKDRQVDLKELKPGYKCRVAGTVGLASTAVMGISESYHGPLEPVYKAALSLGIANQLTNVLRDVGEDIDERDRIYLPTDELDRFGITEKEASSCLLQIARNIDS